MKTHHFTGTPAIAVTPGDILKRELDARGLTQKEFAQTIGRPEQVVSEVIRGKKSITVDTAIAFGDALGIEAEFWLTAEMHYRLDSARRALAGNRSDTKDVSLKRGRRAATHRAHSKTSSLQRSGRSGAR